MITTIITIIITTTIFSIIREEQYKAKCRKVLAECRARQTSEDIAAKALELYRCEKLDK